MSLKQRLMKMLGLRALPTRAADLGKVDMSNMKIKHGLTLFLWCLILICTTFFINNKGYTMQSNSLVNEVNSYKKPEKFIPLDISFIVKKYIQVGMEKHAAIDILKKQGLEVIEKVETKHKQCSDSDDEAIFASFTNKNKGPFMPDESFISIRVELKLNEVVCITAGHTKNVY